MPPPPAPPAPPPPPPPSVTGGCCSGPSLAYLLLRVGLGMLLLLTGVEKFKSPQPPYHYGFNHWHDKKNEAGQVVEPGAWVKVAKPVFEFGGFSNTQVFGEKGVNFLSHVFKGYAQALPYAMAGVGLCILFGFLNTLSLFLGGAIWLSLAMGQMTLPDNPTVLMLMIYTMFYVVALALVKYNRCGITRF